MIIDWQLLLTLPIIGAAALVVLRRLWLMGRRPSGCSGCAKTCQPSDRLITLE